MRKERNGGASHAPFILVDEWKTKITGRKGRPKGETLARRAIEENGEERKKWT